MASTSTVASNYFIPQQLVAVTSSNVIERSDLSPGTDVEGDVDTATFLGQLVQRHVPVFSPEKVPTLTKLRDLGRGGSFTAIAGTLADDFQAMQLQFIAGIAPMLMPTTYKAGKILVARHLNFNTLEQGASEDRRRLLAPLSTEILILSDDRIRRHNQIVELIGVGWESSPYDESEVPRHWPFVLTAFGSQGTLQDLFRDIHRRNAPDATLRLYRPAEMLLQKPVDVDWEYHMDVNVKLALASQIAAGLAFLHSSGVVHGDIKFENIVFGSKIADDDDAAKDEYVGTAQLCDFGSSFLLSDAENGETMCVLRSYSFPWEAPEVQSPIPAKDLPRTDIYSFGLVFARILLDGNDPFDPSYHIASGLQASYDTSKIQQLKMEDKVADTVIDRIKSLNIFEDEKLFQYFERIIQQTVRTDPKKRWQTMEWLSESLQQAVNSNGSSLLNSDTVDGVNPDNEDTDIFAETENFVRMDYSGDGWMQSSRIPNLQSEPFSPHLGSKYIMREVFLDISKQCVAVDLSQGSPAADPTAASAALQQSLCYLHGWGTARSATTAMLWLKTAALQGCQEAQRLVFPLSKSLNLEVETHIKDFVINALRAVYKESNDRLIEWALQEYDTAAYPALVEENRTTYVDGRHRYVRYPYHQKLHEPVKLRPIQDLLQLCEKHGINRNLGFGMTYLHCASAAGDLEVVRALATRPQIDLDARNEDGQTPLLIASCNGHADVVLELLGRGAHPNYRAVDGAAPLHFLARFPEASIESVGEALVRKGASMNTLTAKREGPMTTAMQMKGNFNRQGEVTAMRTMMKLGADPFVSKNEEGEGNGGVTSIAYSFMYGDADAILAILDFAVESRKQAKRPSFFKRIRQRLQSPKPSPQDPYNRFYAIMFRAMIQSQLPLQRLIGLAVNGTEAWKKVFDAVQTQDSRMYFAEETNGTPLRLAYKHQAFDLARVLLENSVMFDASEVGLSVLVDAAFVAQDIELVKNLFALGLTLEFSQYQTKHNLLHLAAKCRWTVEDVKSLFGGEDQLLRKLVNELNAKFENPFDVAVLFDRLHMAEYFRQLGAEHDTQHQQLGLPGLTLNFSLLFRVISFGDDNPANVRRIRYLLQLDPAFVVSNTRNTTALTCGWHMWADQRKRYFNPEVEDPFSNDVLEMLLDHFSKPELINTQDSLGVTPLHFAARTGNIRAIELLLKRGADINAIDGGGDTPLDTVGDHFYALMSKAQSHILGQGSSEGEFLFVDAEIEMFLYREVRELLIKHGAKSGQNLKPEEIKTQLFREDTMPEEELSKIRAAEQWYASNTQTALSKEKSPFIKPGTDRDVFTRAPQNRRDLGNMTMTLHNNDDEPLIHKYDAAHGKGKERQVE